MNFKEKLNISAAVKSDKAEKNKIFIEKFMTPSTSKFVQFDDVSNEEIVEVLNFHIISRDDFIEGCAAFIEDKIKDGKEEVGY